MKQIFYDLETTGTKYWRNSIHQLSGLVVIDGEVKEEFNFHVQPNPKAEIEEEALKIAADSLDKLLLEGAYAYAFPYADGITDVPVFSSQYDIEDETVPFYQMVMGGTAALYSEPLNESGNIREMFLKSLDILKYGAYKKEEP